MLCTKNEWVEFLTQNKTLAYESIFRVQHLPANLLTTDGYGWNGGMRLKPELNYDEMCQLLDNIHDGLIHGDWYVTKGIRPWSITDLTSSLPQDKPWIGWEIETGWEEDEDRAAAVQHIMDNYMHTAYDNEGHGEYCVEFTFRPHADYSGMIHPLIAVCRLASKNPTLYHEECDMIGTHINISTPTFRSLSTSRAHIVAECMDRSRLSLGWDECEELFGRPEPFGGFDVRFGGDDQWVEGKLFNTTYDEGQAENYIFVGDNIAKTLEEVSKFVLDGDFDPDEEYIAIENFYACLASGDVPYFSVNSKDDGLYDGEDIW